MHALSELVQDLERGSGSGSLDRGEVLGRIVGLFAARERRLQDEEAALFDHVFLQLAEEADVAARVTLAQALADSPRAPSGVIERLARDPDPQVAEPVLERALGIHTATLVTLASTYSERHQLAIARRAALAAPVSKALATRGSVEVLRTLARNAGAEIDDDGFALLAARARENVDLIDVLCVRGDIPDGHHVDLLAIDFVAVCEAFDAEYGALELLGVDVVPIVVGAMVDDSRKVYGPEALAASLEYVKWRIDTDAFRLVHVERWLERRQTEDVVACLSLLAGIPSDIVQRLCFAASPIPAAMLFKALGLSFMTLKAFLRLYDADALPLEEQIEVHDMFDSISKDVAARVVRHAALCVRVQTRF